MAKVTYLEFEKPVAQLEEKIQELRDMSSGSEGLDLTSDINGLEKKKAKLLKEIFNKLSPWEMSLLARHPNRPYTLDYINMIFTDFHELHGDRAYADDPSIVGGMARFNGEPVMVIGHQKGRDTRERTLRNFGMSRPEGYRKALRLMQIAEKFSMPIFTFVDTPGAYPGIGAEERGQSEAIGHNIYEMSHLKTPIIVTIIGEGGSGGALAIAVGDVVNMLQYSIYSVISPEGCASILWKDASRAPEAAQALGLTADRLRELGLVDRVLTEPLGGAHRDPHLMGASMKKLLTDQMRHFLALPVEELVKMRLERLLQYGKFEIKALEEAQPIEAGLQAQAAEQARSAEPVSDTPVEAEKPMEAEKTGDTEKPAQAEPEKEAKRTVRKRTVRKTDATKKTASKKA